MTSRIQEALGALDEIYERFPKEHRPMVEGEFECIRTTLIGFKERPTFLAAAALEKLEG